MRIIKDLGESIFKYMIINIPLSDVIISMKLKNFVYRIRQKKSNDINTTELNRLSRYHHLRINFQQPQNPLVLILSQSGDR